MPKTTKSLRLKKRKKITRVPALFTRLRKHFSTDPGKLPVVEQTFQLYDRANLHITIEELLAKCNTTLIGIVLPHYYDTVSLAKISRESTAKGYEEGPVEYVDVELADNRRLACVKQGLYTFHDDGQPVVLLITPPLHHHDGGIRVVVMAVDREAAEQFTRKLAQGVRHGSAFRGKVLSVEQNCYGQISIRFHKLPTINREGLILPEELLHRIERQAMGL